MKKVSVYMDHGATTPLRREVLEAMLPYLEEQYANPSSQHSPGRVVRRAVEETRERVASLLGTSPGEIFFTSGATEANNLALRGIVRSQDGPVHLITSAIEHHAVLDVCRDLEKEGHRVTYLPVDRDGLVSLEEAAAAVSGDTVLMSVMAANNEVGTLQPVAELAALARERGIYFHCDAVQVTGQLPFSLETWPVDSLALSAHKFNGPKGAGILYCRHGLPLQPLWQGGGQEKGLRPGTENVAAIIGMGKALELAVNECASRKEHLLELRERLTGGLLAMDQVVLNGHPHLRLPGNINVSFRHIEGEAVMLGLDLAGIAVSTGSACSSGSLEPSHVVTALGLERVDARASVRFSLGMSNTRGEVDYVLEQTATLVQRLRSMSPTYRAS